MQSLSFAPKNSWEYTQSQSVMEMIQLSYSCFQYILVCFYHSKSLMSLHLSSTARSLWCTCTVTIVSIFCLSMQDAISSRHILVNSSIMAWISLLFPSKAPFSFFYVLSSPSVIFWVHTACTPIRATWEGYYLMKSLIWGTVVLEHILQASLMMSFIVSCIFS